MANNNVETRFANRTRSVFSAIGQIISNFYLEAGIYCVGGLNASLVAWGIYTDLVAEGQPLAYAIGIGVIALIAVEGLAVYLVGAAARTGSNLLWFFSIVFATFFTWAHIREMQTPGVIAQYVTVAIPFFVVIGYWARTIKVDTEAEAETAAARKLQAEKLQREVDKRERLRQETLEDDKRAWEQEQERLDAERKHEIKMAKLTPKPVKFDNDNNMSNSGQNPVKHEVFGTNFDNVNAKKKTTKTEKLDRLRALLTEDENRPVGELAGELGVTRQTIYNYKRILETDTNGVI